MMTACLSMQLLFGELLTTRPVHRAKLRWRDVVSGDVQRMGFVNLSWFSAAQDCSQWSDACQPILFLACITPTINSKYYSNLYYYIYIHIRIIYIE